MFKERNLILWDSPDLKSPADNEGKRDKNKMEVNIPLYTVGLSVLTALPLLASNLLSTLSESLACWWIQSVPQ